MDLRVFIRLIRLVRLIPNRLTHRVNPTRPIIYSKSEIIGPWGSQFWSKDRVISLVSLISLPERPACPRRFVGVRPNSAPAVLDP